MVRWCTKRNARRTEGESWSNLVSLDAMRRERAAQYLHNQQILAAMITMLITAHHGLWTVEADLGLWHVSNITLLTVYCQIYRKLRSLDGYMESSESFWTIGAETISDSGDFKSWWLLVVARSGTYASSPRYESGWGRCQLPKLHRDPELFSLWH